jgi:hypothetical protein
MRNLSLHALSVVDVSTSGGSLSRVAINTDNGTTFAVTEHVNGDADIEFEIWKLGEEPIVSPTV